MTVQVNGKPVTLGEDATVATLITVLQLTQKKVAVEVNKELVVRKQWDAMLLHEGDRVEVVSFVGGG